MLVKEHDLFELPQQWVFNTGSGVLGCTDLVGVGVLNLEVEIGLTGCFGLRVRALWRACLLAECGLLLLQALFGTL